MHNLSHTYTASPDDGLLIRRKNIKVSQFNKLKINVPRICYSEHSNIIKMDADEKTTLDTGLLQFQEC
jgi:hypothetical protein